MASGRSLSIAAKALSNSSLLLILIDLIAVPVASPPRWICSRKGLEKGSVPLVRTVTRRADGSMSRINWTLLPANSAVTLAMPVTEAALAAVQKGPTLRSGRDSPANQGDCRDCLKVSDSVLRVTARETCARGVAESYQRVKGFLTRFALK
jgi:hypothetical protein